MVGPLGFALCEVFKPPILLLYMPGMFYGFTQPFHTQIGTDLLGRGRIVAIEKKLGFGCFLY
jgi:hypothetical protein